MARYELRGPDGARYEIEAPNAASEAEVMARFREHVGQEGKRSFASPAMAGANALSTEERSVADRPMAAPERYTRLAASYVPGSERIAAATYAAIPGAMDPSIDAGTFGERYDRALRVTRARNDAAQADPDVVGGTIARTAGLGAAAVGTGGFSLLRSALPATASLPQVMKEGARIGAGVGAPTGYLNSRADDPLSRAADVGEGALGGAAIGGGLPLGFAGLSLLKRPFRPSDASRAKAAAVREDFEKADVPVFGPALSDAGTIQRTGRGLAGSFLGRPLGRQAEASKDALEARAREAVNGPSGAPGPAQFGDETQAFLRHNLKGYSRPSSELDAMTPGELGLVRGRGGVNPAETYPTQFGARYRLAEQEPVPGYTSAANVRGNFVDRLPERSGGPTATWRLLDDLGRTARAAGQLKGWKEGDFENPAFWQAIKRNFGDDIGGLLQSEHRRAAAGQANLTIPGLRDMRTLVRRTMEDQLSGNNPMPAAAVTGSAAALQRLHGAMTQDMRRFLNSSGGSNAALNYLSTDRAYSNFTRDLRKPLRALFGDQVKPDEAFNRLWRATQRDTQDTQLLGAYYRTLGEKGASGAPTRATRALFAPAMENGLPGFLKGYDNLSPEAKRIMFRDRDGLELQTSLDRLARVAKRLGPYSEAGARGFDLSRPSNVALGLGLFYHIPATIAAAGGVHVLARAMASPRFVRWLSEVPAQSAWGVRSPAFQAHLARGAALAADDAELGQATVQAVGDVLRPGQAKAMGPLSGSKPPEEKLESGSSWFDNLSRLESLRNPKHQPEASPSWMPAKPDLQSRDNNSFKPGMFQDFPVYPDPVEGDRKFGQKVTFAGESAATADKAALGRAQEMTAQGADRETVWKETGWFQGPDKKWRHEILDAEDAITGKHGPANFAKGFSFSGTLSAIKTSGAPKTLPLSDVLQHAPLLAAYPELGSLPVVFTTADGLTNKQALMQYSPSQGLIRVNADGKFSATSPPLASLLHEVQHAIQHLEGFTYGNFENKVEPSAFGPPWAWAARPGENEARNVEKRMDRSGRKQPPWRSAPLDEHQLLMEGAKPFAPERPPGIMRLGGPLSLAREPGTEKALFAGKNAATADKEALAKAQEMHAAGDKPETIWKAAGWLQGKDGVWRNEIDDSKAKMRLPDMRGLKSGGASETTLGAVLDHPDFFAAYPALGKVKVILHNRTEMPDGVGVAQTFEADDEGGERIEVALKSEDDLRRTLLHEAQHLIEPRENFDYGSGKNDKNTYERRSGEVDARNVEARATMSPAERRATPPTKTQDVPWPKVLLSPERQEELRRGRHWSTRQPRDDDGRFNGPPKGGYFPSRNAPLGFDLNWR